MKKLLPPSVIFSLLLLISLSSNAQEKTRFKCAYQFDFLRDTIDMKYFRQETYILQIGENVTKGFTYHKTYVDSLQKSSPELFRDLYNKEVIKAREIRKRTGSTEGYTNSPLISSVGGFPADIYKDYKKNEIRVVDFIFINPFVYKDELKPQEWEILSDTATILGYACQKAICSYRGRDYEAWFTLDIPISEGPWKFYGLPGLITKLHDTKKHYSFELTGFQEIKEDINTKINKNVQKIERKEFYRNQRGEKGRKIMEADMAAVGLPTTPNEDKPQPQYDLIERDYHDE